MKKTIAAVVISIIVILIGWLVYLAFQPTSTLAPVTEQTATTTPVINQYTTISGVRVKIGPSFSIPSVATGTAEIGAGQSWGTYTDPVKNFSLDYPAGIMAAYFTSTDIQNIKSYLPINPDANIALTLPPSQYPATTTVHDIVIIAAASTTPDFATCINQAEVASQGGATTTIPVQIAIVPPNAAPDATPVDFYQLPNSYGGCWAGGCPFGTLFTTYQTNSNTCYQFSIQAVVTNPGVYAANQNQYQHMNHDNQIFESRLTALFYQILSTVTFQ